MPETAAALAFLLGLAGVGAAARIGRRIGLLDRPDARRVHARPVPRTGGVGALLAGALALALLAPARLGLPVSLGALAFFAVGALDDLGRIAGPSKLCLQVAAAVGYAALSGASLPDTVSLPDPANVALVAAFVLVVTNVVNFLDGIDAITCATGAVLLGAGAGAGGDAGAVYAAALGGLLALAAWNRTPARVFPGDATTHALGFLAATLALDGPAAGAGLPLVAVAAVLLPAALDVAWGVVLKRRHGFGWTAPHRWHPYQRLVAAGTPAVVVAVRYAALSLSCLLLATRGADLAGAVVAALVGLSLLAVHVGDVVRALARAPSD